MITAAAVIVHRGKAYIPTEAVFEEGGGTLLSVDPVYSAALTVDDLTRVLEQVAAAGHPVIAEPKMLGYPPSHDPVLRSAGVRSWPQLARAGASYGIWWRNDGIGLYISRTDKRGRFETDEARTREFPPGTPIRTIVEAILEDVHMRPELMSTDHAQ